MKNRIPLNKSDRIKRNLYLNCALTDFAAFVVIFAVTRGLAESKAAAWYMGVAGAGVSLAAGIGSLLGGWLSHRFDGRAVFLSGAACMSLSIFACWQGNPQQAGFLPGYWLLGLGLGLLYPPLIGWLNQDQDPHGNHRGVSRTLILFCIAWNLGMMAGQLVAGSLFEQGRSWIYITALTVSGVNLIVALIASCRVAPLSTASPRTAAPAPGALELAAKFKRLSWIANLGGMFGGSLVLHLLPELAVEIGVPADRHGVLLACWRAVIIATYLLMHRLTFWHYRFGVSVVSQVLAACGLVMIAVAGSSVTLLIGLALLGQLVGYNYFSGLFYSAAGSSHERRTLAAGIHEATLAIGMAVGTIVGGAVGSLVNQRVPYLLSAALMLILIGVQTAAMQYWWRGLRSAPDNEADSSRIPRGAGCDPAIVGD